MTRSVTLTVKISDNANVSHVDEKIINEETSFFTKLRRRSSAVFLDLFRKRTYNEFHGRRHSYVHVREQEEKKKVGYARRKSIPAYLGNKTSLKIIHIV